MFHCLSTTRHDEPACGALQLSAARDPPDLPADTLRLFVGGRELSSDSALVSEVGLGNGHVMHAQATHRSILAVGSVQRFSAWPEPDWLAELPVGLHTSMAQLQPA